MRFVTSPTSKVRRLCFAIGIVLVTAPAMCHAFHGRTMHAWHRTWYGQDALNTPLRPYFVPRLPGRCDRDPAAGCYEVTACGECAHGSVRGAFAYPGPVPQVWSSVPSERLGQIPNDLGVGGVPPAGAAGR